MRSIWRLAALLLLGAGCAAAEARGTGGAPLPGGGARAPGPPSHAPPQGALARVAFEQRLGQPLPLELRFRDQSGVELSLAEAFGQVPVILTFNYYRCPNLCPLELEGLARALRAVPLEPGRDYRVVTVSIDPRETPADAARKAGEVAGDLAPGWLFLVGEPAAIARLARAAGYEFAYDGRIDQYAHAAGLLVATAEGRLSRYFFGLEYSPRDLRLALVEASGGRVGSPVDHLLLYCYGYDPSTGRYGLIIRRVLQVSALLTAALLSTGVAVLLCWERREA